MQPSTNHSSSAMTARRKTRFVVRRGRIGIGGSELVLEGREREKRSAGGAKRDKVPVPVLRQRSVMASRQMSEIPVWTMLAFRKNSTYQVQILMLFVGFSLSKSFV